MQTQCHARIRNQVRHECANSLSQMSHVNLFFRCEIEKKHTFTSTRLFPAPKGRVAEFFGERASLGVGQRRVAARSINTQSTQRRLCYALLGKSESRKRTRPSTQRGDAQRLAIWRRQLHAQQPIKKSKHENSKDATVLFAHQNERV